MCSGSLSETGIGYSTTKPDETLALLALIELAPNIRANKMVPNTKLHITFVTILLSSNRIFSITWGRGKPMCLSTLGEHVASLLLFEMILNLYKLR
jgi:hypothetical protein